MSNELEPRLRAWLVAQAPVEVPANLAINVSAIPRQVPLRWSDRLRAKAVVAPRATPGTRLVVALMLLLALLVAALTVAGALPSPGRTYVGEFVPTGSMTTARLGHAATLLVDGRVLITGGSLTTDGAALASAETYDPATGTFSETGSMTEARVGHAALRLPDGRVLVGGDAGGGSFDVYDPVTGTFSPAGITHRGALPALLADGRVLITNGDGTATLWDPGTGIDIPSRGTASIGGVLHVAIALPDGKVLVAGRSGGFGGHVSAYDPATDEFTDLKLADGLGVDVATLLDDGRVFLLRQGSGFTYDPRTGAIENIVPGALEEPGGYLATRLADGRVLILANFMYPATELYDPVADTRTPSGDQVQARRQTTATTLTDGRVLVAGGSGPGQGNAMASAELFR